MVLDTDNKYLSKVKQIWKLEGCIVKLLIILKIETKKKKCKFSHLIIILMEGRNIYFHLLTYGSN